MRSMKLFFAGISLFFLFSCQQVEEVKPKPHLLSDRIDSVIYEELRFGITRNEFLKKIPGKPQQNIMTEPWMHMEVWEVEGSENIGHHHFVVYYYFDQDDSLYRVKAEFRTGSKEMYADAAKEVGALLYAPYGIPVRRETLKTWYKFSWDLKNKQIILDCGCIIDNCLVEVIITENRLFAKNRQKAESTGDTTLVSH